MFRMPNAHWADYDITVAHRSNRRELATDDGVSQRVSPPLCRFQSRLLNHSDTSRSVGNVSVFLNTSEVQNTSMVDWTMGGNMNQGCMSAAYSIIDMKVTFNMKLKNYPKVKTRS